MRGRAVDRAPLDDDELTADHEGTTGTGDERRDGRAHVAGPFSVFDDLTDLVVALDPNFDVVYANDFACELLGYEHHEVAGRSITEFLSADDVGRAFEI